MTENNYQGEVFSFYELLGKYKIEIPIIQRDYAQGRKDKKEIRDNFLSALYNSLKNNKPIMLDFIYGSIVEDCFQPLDGQQRLTTLFLLHWYASIKDNVTDEVLNNFTYETRISSREFCKALVSNKISCRDGVDIIGQIVDSSWFFLSWKKDPSINSMLTMIGAIHQQFFHIQNLKQKLISSDGCLIKFYNVELENIGLTDDLYIKMNARGKLLTSFENFKAGLEHRINEKRWEDGVEFQERFPLKIDTDWTDFFWQNFRISNSIDDSIIRFIATIAMVRKASERDEKADVRYNRIKLLHDDYNNVKPDMFTEDDFKYLCECFNLYLEKFSLLQQHSFDFPFWRHSPKNDFLSEVALGKASYTQKVLFFAQTEYLRKVSTFSKEYYNSWMRFVRNVVSQGDVEKSGKRPDIVRSQQTFDGVINLISELSIGCGNISEYLAKPIALKSTFSKNQVEEEITKAKLILEKTQRKNIFHSLEDTDLLRGKLAFPFYCINYSMNKSDFNDEMLLNVKKVITNLFTIECEITNDLRRALLSIEVDGRYEYYNYWWSSWSVIQSDKRCLIDNFRELEYFIYSDSVKYMRSLVLKLFDTDLNGVIESFSPGDSFPNWKLRLIKEKALLDKKSKSNYIAIPEDNSCCYLLKSKRPRDAKGCYKVE